MSIWPARRLADLATEAGSPGTGSHEFSPCGGEPLCVSKPGGIAHKGDDQRELKQDVLQWRFLTGPDRAGDSISDGETDTGGNDSLFYSDSATVRGNSVDSDTDAYAQSGKYASRWHDGWDVEHCADLKNDIATHHRLAKSAEENLDACVRWLSGKPPRGDGSDPTDWLLPPMGCDKDAMDYYTEDANFEHQMEADAQQRYDEICLGKGKGEGPNVG